MPLFQCMNPDCIADQGAFTFEANKPVCPKCSIGPPHIATVVIMHYAYYDPRGTIKGYMGKKIRRACGNRDPISPFTCHTDNIDFVNCPACYRTDIFKQRWSPNPEMLESYFNDPRETTTP